MSYSGRWHVINHPILYTATSIALAALEYAVNTAKRPTDSVLMKIDIPSDSLMTIERMIDGPLPGNWPYVEVQTQHLGSEWLRLGQSVALEVPSVVIPLERNIILNPTHPRFAEVRLVETTPFFFDPRIFATGR